MSKIVALVLSCLVLTWPALSSADSKAKIAGEAAKIIVEALNRIQVTRIVKPDELQKVVAVVAEERAKAGSGATFEYLSGKLTVPESTKVGGLNVTGGEVNLYKVVGRLATGGGGVALLKCGLDKECRRRVIDDVIEELHHVQSKTEKTSD